MLCFSSFKAHCLVTKTPINILMEFSFQDNKKATNWFFNAFNIFMACLSGVKAFDEVHLSV